MCRVDCGELPTEEPPTTELVTTTVVPEPTNTPLPPWERQIEITVIDGNWGEWQNSKTMCNNNGYVCGITTRYQKFKGSSVNQDDSSLNGITLECCDWEDNDHHFPQIKSVSNGFEGDQYNTAACGKYKFICGLRAKYAAPGYNDETALNGLEIRCCDKYIWASHDIYPVVLGDFGEWQNNFTLCPNNYYVCGMTMKEQEYSPDEDNTAANGIKVTCCAKP